MDRPPPPHKITAADNLSLAAPRRCATVHATVHATVPGSARHLLWRPTVRARCHAKARRGGAVEARRRRATLQHLLLQHLLLLLHLLHLLLHLLLLHLLLLHLLLHLLLLHLLLLHLLRSLLLLLLLLLLLHRVAPLPRLVSQLSGRTRRTSERGDARGRR